MLTDVHNPYARVLREEIQRLADHWANLGVCCTLWRRTGQLIAPVPKSSEFWKMLWMHGQGFRNLLSEHVRQCPSSPATEELADTPLRIYCAPLTIVKKDDAVLAICVLGNHCDWDEGFARICSQWHLDTQAFKRWGQQHARYDDVQIGEIVGLVQGTLSALSSFATQRAAVEHMTTQLTSAYEELNLIYRIGANMRVTEEPREHFGRLFADLSKTTPITTMAAVLYDTEVLDPENRLIIGGEPIVDEAQVLKVADHVGAIHQKATNALVINNIKEYAQLDWARSWLERLIAVPIICNQANLGLLLAINQRGNLDFDSTDVRLLHSVVDRTAVYLENVLLYGDLNKLLMGLLHALVNSIDAKDTYTCGHSNRVAMISRRIAERLDDAGLPPERVYLSGLLHDIGKIGISELILCKPGRLNDEEMEEMRRHPEIGARILSGIKQLDDLIPAVLHNHEWINGTGYPRKLAGEEIPWVARIVGLADAFDAMTTGRTYRSALPLASALAEIRRYSGTQFSPELVDVLIELVAGGLAQELKRVKKTPAFDSVYTRWTRKVNYR